MPRRATIFLLMLSLIFGLIFPISAFAHNVSKRDASFVESNQGAAIAPFLYLGAKHMVTGYDHLAFLVGVIFFLYRLKDVVLYVSLFTIGHSVTLLSGVLGGIHANPFVVDAIIGFSVVYKAFDNMDGFWRLLGFEPSILDFREYFSVNFSVLLVFIAVAEFLALQMAADRAAAIRAMSLVNVLAMAALFGTSLIYSVPQGLISCATIAGVFLVAWWRA